MGFLLLVSRFVPLTGSQKCLVWGLTKLRRWKSQGGVKETLSKAALDRQKYFLLKANCFGRLLDFFQLHRGQTWILILFCNDTNLKYSISSDGLNGTFPQILSLCFSLKIQKWSSWSYNLMNSRILKDPSKEVSLALFIIPIPPDHLLLVFHYPLKCFMGMCRS